MKETEEILKALIAKEQELVVQVNQLKDAENELIKIKAAIKALSPDYKSEFKFTIIPTNTPFAGGESYNPGATWKEKIKYVVKVKGHAGIKAISDFISEKEPHLDAKKVYGSVAVNVGDMVNNQNTLKAKSMGGKNEYFINE